MTGSAMMGATMMPATGTRAAIFGTGAGSFLARENLLALGAQTVAFLDNDPARQGGTHEGLPVLAPEAAPGLGCDIVLLASHAHAAMEAQLAGLGIPPERILSYPGIDDRERGLYHRLGQARYRHPRWRVLNVPLNWKCNLTCRHCIRLDLKTEWDWQLDQDTFLRYLAAFSPDRFDTLTLHGGEITLTPGLLPMLQAAVARGWTRLNFVTNGTARDDTVFRYLLANGLLTDLFVSAEAASPALYRSIRGASFERFSAFTRHLAALRDEYGASTPLSFNVTCMRENLAEMPALVDLAADLGLNAVSYVPMFTYEECMGEPPADFPAGKLCVDGQRLSDLPRERVAEVFGRVLERSRARGVAVHLPEPFPELTGAATADGPGAQSPAFRCSSAFEWVTVRGDGEIFPCCLAGATLPSLGSLNTASFEEIWNGPGYASLLAGLAPGGRPPARCVSCPAFLGLRAV
jgi:MoaA/NifB/PqqE/SkfB family radical SAM enzyme